MKRRRVKRRRYDRSCRSSRRAFGRGPSFATRRENTDLRAFERATKRLRESCQRDRSKRRARRLEISFHNTISLCVHLRTTAKMGAWSLSGAPSRRARAPRARSPRRGFFASGAAKVARFRNLERDPAAGSASWERTRAERFRAHRAKRERLERRRDVRADGKRERVRADARVRGEDVRRRHRARHRARPRDPRTGVVEVADQQRGHITRITGAVTRVEPGVSARAPSRSGSRASASA